MRKSIKVGLATGAMMLAGIGAAQAATTGSFSNLSVSGATATGNQFNVHYAPHNCQTASICEYYSRVAGDLKITTGDAHLQVRSAAYAYVTIFNSSGTFDGRYAKVVSPGDELSSSSLTLQLCHEKVLADECKTSKVTP